VNVSIRDGALIEIKGVQELELISQVIENEVQRQLSLLEIREELKKRGIKKEDITEDFVDVTQVFKNTKCKVIAKAIKQNKPVLAVRLAGFAGLLKKELALGMRLGSELAGMARFWGRVGGIFHTDEMPAYGVTAEELNQIGQLLKKDSVDAVVFVADKLDNAVDALKAVTERARVALKGVPEETRAANPDGTTKYMRPRPGAARMYPETDVPPIQVTKAYISELSGRLPELPEQLMKRLMKDYKLNQKLSKQILDSEYLELFESLAGETKVSATVIAVALTETLKALRRDGINVEAVTDEQFMQMFMLIGSGKTAKESIPEILTWLASHEEAAAEEALKSLGLGMISMKEVEELVDDVIEKNTEFIEIRGKGALGALMGILMKKARGRVKAKVVNEILRKRLEDTTS